jgi:hypothetical protein
VSDGNSLTRRLSGIASALPWIFFGVVGCAGTPPSARLLVKPSPVEVAAGSTTSFTAVFTRGVPDHGSLTWSVVPSNGGTITSGGVYTASGKAGTYTVVATWTLVNFPPEILHGSATVEVLPAPQVDSALSPNLVQASGAIQLRGTIQNAAIAGQLVPAVISKDPNGDIQVRSGFTPPVACKAKDVCYSRGVVAAP